MPPYIACPRCNKSGMVKNPQNPLLVMECPCCGSAARRMLHVEGFINQAGWTTKEFVNSYYRRSAEVDARAIVKRAMENLAKQEAGQPPMSNQLRKRKEKEIMTKMMAHLLAGKYKLLE
jgi:hypothetical protein